MIPFCRVAVPLVLTGLLAATLWAQPDLRQMAGTPLPSADLPDGTVSVRVVRRALSNNVPNQSVELVGAAEPFTAVTDENGRAQFENVPQGAQLRAVTVVDDERLESQPFQVPPRGGVRLLLAAGLSGASSESVPPQPGEVALGNNSRFIIELAEGSLEVFSALEIVNPEATPVQPSEALLFELPGDAQSATVLEGSTKQARVEGQRVLVTGPFPPGATPVQFAYRVPYANGRLTVQQPVPLALGQLNVAVRRAGEMRADVQGASNQRETTFEGRTYIVASGGRLGPGDSVRIHVEGLPHHPRWPMYLAVGLAATLLLGAAVVLLKQARDDETGAAALDEERRRLLQALVAVERQHAAGSLDASTYAAKRSSLVEALEPFYEQLDRLQRYGPAAHDEESGRDLQPKAARPDPLARA